MSRKVIVGALCCVMLLALGGQQLLAQRQPAPDVPLIRLKTATFDPQAGEPALPQPLRAQATSGPSTYLIQFAGPIQEDWKAAVQQAGVRLYGYIPDNALIARADSAALARAQALPFVRWAGAYHPAYRLEPALATTPAAGDVELTVQTLPDADLGAVAAQLAKLGGRVEGQAANPVSGYLRATLPASQLTAAAALDQVLWVAPYMPAKLFNEIGGGQIMRANEVRQSLGLFGAGQIVGVADTGLDVGNPTTLHPDIRGRVVNTYCLGRTAPCDWSDHDAHGTHVAGSVLGNGTASGSNAAAHQYAGSHAGVAPEARLVFQSIEASDGSLNGIPNDEGDLMRQAYTDGARIHTNSWGGPTGGTQQSPQYGGYISTSQMVDQAAWEHKDQLILFAAGNSGTDANGNGVIDPDSIGQPGTAKNIITVGASENLRASGGYNPGGPCTSWGDCWPTDFGTPPLAGDAPSDDANGMAAFSSRGPTDDGRIKPELAAPGTNIVSVRSHQAEAGTGWGVFDSNYIYEGGTSMATPLTAGAAAVTREWLTRIKGVANPSAALMKSVMINGAADMSPGQYGTGATQEIPSRRPNNVSGWGRVDLKEALDPPAPRKNWFVDNTSGLSTGQTASYQVTISGAQAASAAQAPAGPLQPVATRGADAKAQPLVGSSGVSPQATSQILQNGGFENATFTPWATFGNTASNPTLDTVTKHSGAKSGHLGGANGADDELHQTLSIPAGTSDVTIDFWYNFNTSETLTGFDTFCYGLYATDSATAYAKRCGDFGTIGSVGWTRETYSLSASELASVAGKSTRFVFYVVTDGFSDPSEAWVDDAAVSITTGAVPSATPTATSQPGGSGDPLRVTLAWTDYPGQPAAAKALVNDLDLEIVAPNGTHYTGNQGLYTSGQCLRDAKWDACNNVEGVILPQAGAGTYTIIVRAAQVPQGGQQPFALTASGNNLQLGGGLPQRPRSYLPSIMNSSQGLTGAPASGPDATPAAEPARAAAPGKPQQSGRVGQP